MFFFFSIVLVCFYTRGIGRAQAPDMTLGGVSGTISSSSLYQWNVVSFFTLATWQIHRQHQCFLGGWGLGPLKEHRGKVAVKQTEYLAGQHDSALLGNSEVEILCKMRTWKQTLEHLKWMKNRLSGALKISGCIYFDCPGLGETWQAAGDVMPPQSRPSVCTLLPDVLLPLELGLLQSSFENLNRKNTEIKQFL